MGTTISRRAHICRHVRPTVGDRIRLADTESSSAADRAITRSTARKSSSAAARSSATAWGEKARASRAEGADTVITNAAPAIIDLCRHHQGVIGITGGRTSAASCFQGQPDISRAIDIVAAPARRSSAARGQDRHIRRHRQRSHPSDLPTHSRPRTLWRRLHCARAAAATRLRHAGDDLHWASSSSMLRSGRGHSVNLSFFGKDGVFLRRPAAAFWSGMIEAGACGLKLHEDWGAPRPRRSIVNATYFQSHATSKSATSGIFHLHRHAQARSGFVLGTIAPPSRGRNITPSTEGVGKHLYAPQGVQAYPTTPLSTNPTRPTFSPSTHGRRASR